MIDRHVLDSADQRKKGGNVILRNIGLLSRRDTREMQISKLRNLMFNTLSLSLEPFYRLPDRKREQELEIEIKTKREREIFLSTGIIMLSCIQENQIYN